MNIVNKNFKHSYAVYVRIDSDTFETWYIDANNRNQAAKIAKKHGGEVFSVNMVG